MCKCSARRKARFMCTFRTPRQTASKTTKCILSSSFLTQAKPWRLEGAEPTFPGTWEWVVLPDMGGTFDKVEERLLAGSSLFLFSTVVSIPTCHAGDRGSIPTISQKRRTSSTLGRPTHNSGTQALTHLKLTNDKPLGPSGRKLFKKNHFRVSVTTTSCGRTKANLVPLDAEWPIIPTHNLVSSV